ncbi:MAG: OmpH family outer membrane protein [Paramuribaculum sp.]|nr:OmpH family outer membrane protein [Paramuribaculum sp.]MDE6303499.1 OmpH family outer membrane protein [Paramuribaculum sp.]
MKFSAFANCSLLAVASLLAGCANNQSSSTPDAVATTPAATQPTTLNIRFIDSDSIAAHYNLAKDFQEVSIREYSKLENAQQSKAAAIQKLAAQIEEKARNNGYLSEASYNADMTKLNRMQQEAQTSMAAMQRKSEQELMELQQALTDSINSFIADYNATKGYDAILYRAAGVYFNPALDITKEIIEGLNARYNKISDTK